MAVLRKRNRLVYFRVSEVEFEKFRELCQRAGASSLSELARNAMQRMLDNYPTEGPATDLQGLHRRVTALEAKLPELAACIQERSSVEDFRAVADEKNVLVSE